MMITLLQQCNFNEYHPPHMFSIILSTDLILFCLLTHYSESDSSWNANIPNDCLPQMQPKIWLKVELELSTEWVGSSSKIKCFSVYHTSLRMKIWKFLESSTGIPVVHPLCKKGWKTITLSLKRMSHWKKKKNILHSNSLLYKIFHWIAP